jgi:hypothetical protein
MSVAETFLILAAVLFTVAAVGVPLCLFIAVASWFLGV